MHVRTPSVGTLGGLQTAPVVVKGPRREWRKPKPTMNGLKKSDEAVRPVRAANKGARASAESPEERASTKGNPDCQSTYVDAPCSARRNSNNFCGMRSLSRPRRPRYIGVLQAMSLPPSPAPIATGWSDSCRAGFAPARRRRLSTAHRPMRATSIKIRVTRWTAPSGTASSPSRTAWWR